MGNIRWRVSRYAINSKNAPAKYNIANYVSRRTIEKIILDNSKKENGTKKPTLGPRMRIIEFMNKYGVNVSDDDILTYMKKQMPTLGEDYIKRLIYNVRNEIKKEREEKAGEKGDDR